MGLPGLRAARMSTRPCGSGAVLCSSDTSARTRAGGPWPVGRRGGWRRASSQGWAPQVLPVGEATSVLPEVFLWPGTVGVVRCYCPCVRDSVVSMEIASLTRRPRVRVTEVMGSEPIAWNSLSVRSPVGA